MSHRGHVDPQQVPCPCRELAHLGKDLQCSVFLEALAQREESNRSGKLTVSALTILVSTNNEITFQSLESIFQIIMF